MLVIYRHNRKEMGMPAKHFKAEAKPQINDIILRGYLIFFDEE